jgi:hypothetical protein
MKTLPLAFLALVLLMPLSLAQVEFSSLEIIKDDKILKEALEVEGGETVRFVLRAHNIGLEDITDAYLHAEIDELDLADDSKEEDVDSKEKGRFVAELKLPLVLDSETYEVEISLESDGGTLYEVLVPIAVKKYTHLVRVVDYDLFPQIGRCGQEVRVTATIVNLGEEQEHLRVFFGSEGLRSSALSEESRLKATGSEYEVSAVLRIPESAATSDYVLEIVPRYPFAHKDKEALSVNLPVLCEQKEAVVQDKAVVSARKVVRLDPAPLVTPSAHVVYDPYQEVVVYAQKYAVELLVLTLLLSLLVLSILLMFLE